MKSIQKAAQFVAKRLSCMMFILVILKVLILISFVEAINLDYINSLKGNLSFHNPVIITKGSAENKHQIFKTFSNQNEYVTIMYSSQSLENAEFRRNVILIPKSFEETIVEVDFLKKIQCKVIVVQEDNLFEDAFLKTLDLDINHEVYFLLNSTKEVLESYKINDLFIKRTLGRIDETKFKWNENIEPIFTKRRSNFYGLNLKAFTEASGRDIVLDARFRERAPFSEASKTYMVNDFTSGLHYDILKLIESNLNFTTHLMKTKDQNWGYIKEINGTVKGEGIIYEMYKRKADFILASIAITQER